MPDSVLNCDDVVLSRKPFAAEPDGGWSYNGGAVAGCLYRYDGDTEDRETIVDIPDQVFADQHAYDGLAFPTAGGCYVWLDGEAYGLDTPGTGDVIVRDAVPPTYMQHQ